MDVAILMTPGSLIHGLRVTPSLPATTHLTLVAGKIICHFNPCQGKLENMKTDVTTVTTFDLPSIRLFWVWIHVASGASGHSQPLSKNRTAFSKLLLHQALR